jgi:hypothetical protein
MKNSLEALQSLSNQYHQSSNQLAESKKKCFSLSENSLKTKNLSFCLENMPFAFGMCLHFAVLHISGKKNHIRNMNQISPSNFIAN